MATNPLKRPADTQFNTITKRLNVRTNAPHIERKYKRDAEMSTTPTDKGVIVPNKVLDILEDIKALGGNEEDIQLLEGLSDSESEVLGEGTKLRDQALDCELATFANTLFPDHSLPLPGVTLHGRELDKFSQKDSLQTREPTHAQAVFKVGLIFPPRIDWHAAIELDSYDNGSVQHGVNFLALKRHAFSLLQAEAENYAKAASSSSSKKFLSAVMADGTMSDRVSALTLAIQESPVHNVKAFENLLSLASKKNRTQAVASLEAIVDLLGPGSLLPPDRRLRSFHAQPFIKGISKPGNSITQKEEIALLNSVPDLSLIYGAFEEWLKETCFRVVQLLEVLCLDEIEHSRIKGLDLVASLLTTKPEQEANLLRLLVSKLGDKERRVSSRASYLILQLQNSHPRMKTVILSCIEKELLLDPSQGFHAKYYAVNTLNQTILNVRAPALTEALIAVYFALFADVLKANQLSLGETKPNGQSHMPRPKLRRGSLPVVKDKGATSVEAVDKLVSAILIGINRAIPFVSGENSMLASHIDVLFRVAHSANFNTSVQALLLVQRLTGVVPSSTDRFYRTLYESLLDPRLANSSKHTLYLNLLLRSVQSDINIIRVKAFAKRMLQVATLHNVPFACGLLYVVSQVRLSCSTFDTLLNQPEENEEPHGIYDGRKRDPEHSNAHRSCLWEIEPFLAHFHPTVVAASTRLVSGSEAMIKPDLDHHTLIRFLDKFAFKAPKTSGSSRGVSIMQPRTDTHGQTSDGRLDRSRAVRSSAVNSPLFWNRKVEELAIEDVFFHRYFSQAPYRRKLNVTTEKTSSCGDSANESIDEMEEEIWRALVLEQHDGVGEDDHDLDTSDLCESLDYNDSDSGREDDQRDYEYDLEDQTSDDDVLEDSLAVGPIDEAASFREESIRDDVESVPQQMQGNMDGYPSSKARRSFKSLTTFASAKDYEALLAGEEVT